MAFACPKQTQTFCGSRRSGHGGRGARSSGHGGYGARSSWLELRLNELGEIRREKGELGLVLEGGITVMKLRKLTQLTHEVRKSAWQRYGRPTTSNPETHHRRSRNPPR
nr:hypothetical protein CFP56_41137 [Quercus suber]